MWGAAAAPSAFGGRRLPNPVLTDRASLGFSSPARVLAGLIRFPGADPRACPGQRANPRLFVLPSPAASAAWANAWSPLLIRAVGAQPAPPPSRTSHPTKGFFFFRAWRPRSFPPLLLLSARRQCISTRKCDRDSVGDLWLDDVGVAGYEPIRLQVVRPA